MISLWQNYTEPYSFINNRLRASQTSSCYLSPRSLPYTELIFRGLSVHVRWKRKGNNCILCFFTSFLTISKRKKIFIFVFKLFENPPGCGVMKFPLHPVLRGYHILYYFDHHVTCNLTSQKGPLGNQGFWVERITS